MFFSVGKLGSFTRKVLLFVIILFTFSSTLSFSLKVSLWSLLSRSTSGRSGHGIHQWIQRNSNTLSPYPTFRLIFRRSFAAMKRSKTELEDPSLIVEASPTVKRRRSTPASFSKAPKASTKVSNDEEIAEEVSVDSPTKNSSNKRQKNDAADERSPHIRDPITIKPLPPNASSLKIITWNVNGLKALVQTKKHMLERLVEQHSPDILCLQETKIQEANASEYSNLLVGYEAFFSCSTVKKGYSGTCVLVKKASVSLSSTIINSTSANAQKDNSTKTKNQQTKLSAFFTHPESSSEQNSSNTNSTEPATTNGNTENNLAAVTRVLQVTRDFADPTSGGTSSRTVCPDEGRVIGLETDAFHLVNVYVPNSGEGLKRLDFRLNDWDPAFRAYLYKLHEQKPVILTGDLNVGHLDLDMHNPTAKHIVKQAGLTPQERASFTNLLSGPMKDAFRHLYPDARGQFTYWSQRTFARPVNRGLRLDYFLCSESMLNNDSPSDNWKVHDCYILYEDTVGCSDHCPVVLSLVK